MQTFSVSMECILINLENELPSNPLVEVAFSAIAEWVSTYRYTIGCLYNEFGLCEPNEVVRMAKEIGLTPSQLHQLASEGPGTVNLLKSMLVALHVDPRVLADADPFIRQELQWLCLTCSNKKRCEHELATGTATDHFREFCPNAVSIDELFDQKNLTS
jgi:hypothetical protein